MDSRTLHVTGRTRDAQGKYQKEGLLGSLDDYLVKPLQGGRLFEISVTTAGMNLSSAGR